MHFIVECGVVQLCLSTIQWRLMPGVVKLNMFCTSELDKGHCNLHAPVALPRNKDRLDPEWTGNTEEENPFLRRSVKPGGPARDQILC